MTGEAIGHWCSGAIATVVLSIGACQVLSPSIDLAACITKHALEGESIPQIAEDCRVDIATVIGLLLKSDDPQVRRTAAHLEAMKIRTMVMPTVDAGTEHIKEIRTMPVDAGAESMKIRMPTVDAGAE